MSDSIDEPLESFDAFVSAITDQLDGVEVLYRLAEHAVNVLGADGAGVSLADDGGVLHAVTSINELSTALEDAEARFQQGPCAAAFLTRSVVAVDDLRTGALDWPDWNQVAARRGVRGAIGVPLHGRGMWLGGINVYSLAPRHWGTQEQRRLQLLADLAASHLLHLSEMERTMRHAEQLQHALDSRIVIEQAKGVLAGEFSCTVDHAFTLLRSYARNRGESIRTVAHAVVHQGLRPPRLVRSARKDAERGRRA